MDLRSGRSAHSAAGAKAFLKADPQFRSAAQDDAALRSGASKAQLATFAKSQDLPLGLRSHAARAWREQTFAADAATNHCRTEAKWALPKFNTEPIVPIICSQLRNERMSSGYLHSGDANYDGPDPMAYRLHANAFLECAELALSGIRERGQAKPNMMQNAPVVHLICHSIEMFLKLALYKTGSKAKALKAFELRHNLTNLKEKCENRGVVFSDSVAEMIDVLSPLHEAHKLRYTAFVEAPIWLPFSPSEMVDLTKNLIAASHPSQKA